jgi:hypothetical protein
MEDQTGELNGIGLVITLVLLIVTSGEEKCGSGALVCYSLSVTPAGQRTESKWVLSSGPISSISGPLNWVLTT